MIEAEKRHNTTLKEVFKNPKKYLKMNPKKLQDFIDYMDYKDYKLLTGKDIIEREQYLRKLLKAII